jgi:hypothetical protein
MTPAEAQRAPHAWIGTTAELCDKLQLHRERWGVSSWAVNLNSLPAVASVIERLAGE